MARRTTLEGAATRRRILRAARDTFSELGFSGASLSQIAARADISVPGMYRHFESKAQLLVATLEEALSELRDHAPSSIAELVNWYGQPEQQQVRRLVVEMHAAALRDDAVAVLVRDFAARSAQAMHAMIAGAAGGMDDGETEHLINVLFILMMGICQIDTIAPQYVGDRSFQQFVAAAVGRVMAVH